MADWVQSLLEGNRELITDLLISLGILLVALLTLFLLKRTLRRSMKEKMSKDQLQLINKVINYGVLGGAALLILTQMGQKPSGIVVAGGVAGVILGFASQNVISNLISGIFIMIERPLRIGNSVKINETVGLVEEIRIMSTIVRTFEGLYVRIPNIDVFTNTLINYVANVARRTEYIIGIRYSDDADKAIAVIKKVFDEETLVLVNPAPDVFVDNLGDNSVNLFVRFWTPAGEWWDLKMTLLQKIKKALEANGIQIPFPQRVIWYGQEPEEPLVTGPPEPVPGSHPSVSPDTGQLPREVLGKEEDRS